MSCQMLVRAALAARRGGRWQLGAKCLIKAAPKAANPMQRYQINELAFELAA